MGDGPVQAQEGSPEHTAHESMTAQEMNTLPGLWWLQGRDVGAEVPTCLRSWPARQLAKAASTASEVASRALQAVPTAPWLPPRGSSGAKVWSVALMGWELHSKTLRVAILSQRGPEEMAGTTP